MLGRTNKGYVFSGIFSVVFFPPWNSEEKFYDRFFFSNLLQYSNNVQKPEEYWASMMMSIKLKK